LGDTGEVQQLGEQGGKRVLKSQGKALWKAGVGHEIQGDMGRNMEIHWDIGRYREIQGGLSNWVLRKSSTFLRARSKLYGTVLLLVAAQPLFKNTDGYKMEPQCDHL
jgi:hypothetical protein